MHDVRLLLAAATLATIPDDRWLPWAEVNYDAPPVKPNLYEAVPFPHEQGGSHHAEIHAAGERAPTAVADLRELLLGLQPTDNPRDRLFGPVGGGVRPTALREGVRARLEDAGVPHPEGVAHAYADAFNLRRALLRDHRRQVEAWRVRARAAWLLRQADALLSEARP